MDTWAVQAAAHATLTSGISLIGIPVSGSASLDGFAFGLALAGLAFVAVDSPWRLKPPWSADAWQNAVRRTRGYQQRQRLTAAPLGEVMTEADAATSDGAAPDRAGAQDNQAQVAAAEAADASRPYSDIARRADITQVMEILSRAEAVLGVDGASSPVAPDPVAPDPMAPEEDTADSDLMPAGHRKREQSRIRQRVNLMLAQMLGDDADEQVPFESASVVVKADEDFWGSHESANDDFWGADELADELAGDRSLSVTPAGEYRSKHRLAGPDDHPDDRERPRDREHWDDGQAESRRRPAPRHAAPRA